MCHAYGTINYQKNKSNNFEVELQKLMNKEIK